MVLTLTIGIIDAAGGSPSFILSARSSNAHSDFVKEGWLLMSVSIVIVVLLVIFWPEFGFVVSESQILEEGVIDAL